jgi:hypothetical protein
MKGSQFILIPLDKIQKIRFFKFSNDGRGRSYTMLTQVGDDDDW